MPVFEGPGGPPPEDRNPLTQPIIANNDSIIKQINAQTEAQRVLAQRNKQVVEAVGTLQQGAVESAITATGTIAPAGTQVSTGSNGTIKIAKSPSLDSQKEALQSGLVQVAGQAVALILNIGLLKSGITVPEETVDFLAPILVQAAGAGVSTLILNLPYWRGKKQVSK